MPLSGCREWLNDRYIYRGRSFCALLNVKGDVVSFIERFKTGCVDSRMMYKYIRSIFLFNETVAFFFVEPLYSSIRHSDALHVQKLLKK